MRAERQQSPCSRLYQPGRTSAARPRRGACAGLVRVPSGKHNYTKNAGLVALAAMEEYSGAYMRLLHNVFRVDRTSLVLASDTRTALVALLRDLTQKYYV